MGILDDAIKEHLELKRQHGAAEDELQQLEDEAFGAAERPGAEESAPDGLSEAPTEFMAQPDLEGEDAPRSRRPDVADLQEGPPEAAEPRPEPEPPSEEEAPAMEHEAIAEPPEADAAPQPPEVEPEISSGPTTEEREAIAAQPTEMFDIEAELGGKQVEEAPPEADAEEPAEEDEYEEDDDFWDEKRLSDELDQALEAPSEVEEAEEEEALYEDAATEAEEPAADEPRPAEPEPDQPEHLTPSGDEEDVLEETPDFLEEAPEDDQLWFEQKPPKDFDFDD